MRIIVDRIGRCGRKKFLCIVVSAIVIVIDVIIVSFLDKNTIVVGEIRVIIFINILDKDTIVGVVAVVVVTSVIIVNWCIIINCVVICGNLCWIVVVFVKIMFIVVKRGNILVIDVIVIIFDVNSVFGFFNKIDVVINVIDNCLAGCPFENRCSTYHKWLSFF